MFVCEWGIFGFDERDVEAISVWFIRGSFLSWYALKVRKEVETVDSVKLA